jgi:hypothetical protein
VLCLGAFEAAFVVSFLSLETARRRTLELTCRASAFVRSHLDDIARGAMGQYELGRMKSVTIRYGNWCLSSIRSLKSF